MVRLPSFQPSPRGRGSHTSVKEIEGGKRMDDWDLPSYSDREAGIIGQNPCGIIPIHLQSTAAWER
jgi:hypothetical protein